MTEFFRYVLMLLLSVVVVGVIGKVRAVYCGRYGEPVLQPVWDIVKLLRRPHRLLNPDVSWVFRLAPSVALATVMSAAVVVPTGSGGATAGALMAFNGDFLFFAYTIALGRFFVVLAILDTNSNSGALAAGRYAYIAALMEPAFLMIMAVVAMRTAKVSFVEFCQNTAPVATICAVVVLMVSATVEAGLMPVDDQTTPDKLTMLNNSAPLHYSGVDLAMMRVATALKLTIYASLAVTMLMPPTTSALAGISLYVAGMLLTAVVIGVVESLCVRLTTAHVAQFIVGTTAVALIALAVAAFGSSR
ncbi:respiratory chain complex I subunit 1 family protein [Candidatus Magnetobacterium casense]|uniref:NADH-quinone oxidoreductase subunit H n=1 Tax=Candidatus Magnetobacterium casense TaxID=1455061 RepID=A0ABS6RXA6_9BACT|nr:NADH-quinone oxidoreductase subunit H [Candidatus Magnetobacterium casensis]MBV6341263.1 NADH-quinone oxidoreductase subunit H [Candidatus Magnetobacterium casensis]